AARTGMSWRARVCYRARNLLRLIVTRAHHPQCDPLCRARAHSRHLPQLRDQISDCRGIFSSSQIALRFTTRNPFFSRFTPRAIQSTEEEAAQACANKIAMEDHLPPRSPAPSEIR